MEGHPGFISVSRLSAMGLSDDAQTWSYGEVFFGEQLLDGARVGPSLRALALKPRTLGLCSASFAAFAPCSSRLVGAGR